MKEVSGGAKTFTFSSVADARMLKDGRAQM